MVPLFSETPMSLELEMWMGMAQMVTRSTLPARTMTKTS